MPLLARISPDDRAGVLGIDVQLVGLEGVEEDLRPAQPAAMR